MFNNTQKKLALSFLMLGNKDKKFVLEALSDENTNVLNDALKELEKIGINSASVKYFSADLRIEDSSFGNEQVGNSLLNVSAKISDFAKRNNLSPPQKLLTFIQMANAPKA